MKLLLVAIHTVESPRAVPLGPAMLAAMLKSRRPDSFHIEILDFYAHQSAAECAERILGLAPTWVGFSMYVWNRSLTLEIAGFLKRSRPDVVVFAGGPEASTDRDRIVEDPGIDFVLAGESEEIIVPAMDHLLAGGAPRVVSEVVSVGHVEDLGALPSPFLDGTLNPTDYDGLLWELSRGCPFACDFCYESRGIPGIRRFPAERIREELRLFHELGVEQILVLDPTFNHDKETAKEILRLIADEAPETYFFFEVRSECLDAEMAELFACIGCSLQIGLQSASDDVLRKVNRTIDLADFESKLLLLHEAGVVYGFDLIYGLPGDTFKGFCASLDFAMGLAPNHVDVFPLSVLPGTRLRETAASFELVYQASAPYLVLSSPGFPEADMVLAADLAQAFDLFYNKGKAVPWFAMVIQALGLTPSAFIRAFASWLKTGPEGEILSLQCDFVGQRLGQQGKAPLIPLAIDIITYFACLEFECDGETSVSFNHSPMDVLEQFENGVTDLAELSLLVPKDPCTVSFGEEDGNIAVRIR